MEVGLNMKITCAKRSREEIIKDRDEYDAKKKAMHDQYDTERRNYSKAVHDVYAGVKAEVETQLANFMHTLNLDVHVDSGWGDDLQVRVMSNEHDVHSKDKALSWNWTAQMTKDGELKKESGSWSGLNAVTEAQLESLRQSVACLEILNRMDWESILSAELPNLADYITVNTYDVDHNRPNYEQELLETEIDEAIQNGSWIKGHGYKWYNSKSTVYYKVLKETPKQYEVAEVWEAYMENEVNRARYSHSDMTYKVSKDVFFQLIDKPLEIMDI